MKLSLLIATLTVLLATGGCTVQFPLADHGPTFGNAEESTSASGMRLLSTETDNRNPVKGNSADTPD